MRSTSSRAVSRLTLILVLPALATACAPAAATRPEAVRLSPDRVLVSFAGGPVCSGAWSAAAPSVSLDGCADGWTATVAPDGRSNILRDVVSGVFDALSLDGVLAPSASVAVTGPDGRSTLFVSPAPVD